MNASSTLTSVIPYGKIIPRFHQSFILSPFSHKLRLETPGLSSFSCSTADGNNDIDSTDIQVLFDMQLEKIYKLVDFQIARMRDVAPQDQIVSLPLAVFEPYD